VSVTILVISFSHHFEALQETTDSGRDRLTYTHKLLPGVTQVDNYGLYLAQGLACPESVLDNAKKLAQKLSSRRKVKHGNRNCIF
jgi:DNA mismatch repair ATPase MutS